MQKDLLKKIDTLIEMSGSTANIETLKAELNDIELEIETKKKELDDLKKTMQDEKYIKASDRIIDENIKVSLELKLRKLNNDLKKLTKEIDSVVKEESRLHEECECLKDKISKIQFLIATLKDKLESIENNSETKDYYQKLISDNESKLKVSQADLEKRTQEYQEVSEQLRLLTDKKETLTTNLKKEDEKLKDTVANLASNTPYIDESLKQEDEKKKIDFERKISELEKRKNEILSDAAVIGNDAKEMLVEDDRTGCFAKVKELVELVKTLPYMDIERFSQLEQVLKDAEEKALMERDEFAGMIESRKYDGNDSEIINERGKHLDATIQDLIDEKAYLKEKINKIDNVKVREISSLISATTVVGENLKKEMQEYKNVIENDLETTSPKKKASLVAAYNKKEEELKNVLSVIASYEQEIIDYMKISQEIEKNDIKKIDEKIMLLQEEKETIEKKNMITNKTKDILAIEKDKEKLKQLSDHVKEIIRCEKYKETASEILDAIEMSLGSFEEETTNTTTPILEKVEETPIITTLNENSLNDFRISNDSNITELNRSEKNKDIIPEEPVSFFDKPVDDIVSSLENTSVLEPIPAMNFDIPSMDTVEPIETSSIDELMNSDFTDNEFKPLEELSNPEPVVTTIPDKKLQVIKIEPLESTEKKEQPNEEMKSNDIIIGDIADDDYIDFDSIIGKGDLNGTTN